MQGRPALGPAQALPPRGGGLHEVADGLEEGVGLGGLEGDRTDRGEGLRLRVLAEDRARLFAQGGVRRQHVARDGAPGAAEGFADPGVEQDRAVGRVVEKGNRDAVEVDDDGKPPPRSEIRSRGADMSGRGPAPFRKNLPS